MSHSILYCGNYSVMYPTMEEINMHFRFVPWTMCSLLSLSLPISKLIKVHQNIITLYFTNLVSHWLKMLNWFPHVMEWRLHIIFKAGSLMSGIIVVRMHSLIIMHSIWYWYMCGMMALSCIHFFPIVWPIPWNRRWPSISIIDSILEKKLNNVYVNIQVTFRINHQLYQYFIWW